MLTRLGPSASTVVAPRVEFFCDLARTAGLPHDEVAVVLEHDLYQPFEALMTEGVQELARIPPNILVLAKCEWEDRSAARICALADERDWLILGGLVFPRLQADPFVRISKGRVITSDSLGGQRVHHAPRLGWLLRTADCRPDETSNKKK